MMLDPTKPVGDCTAQELAIAMLIDASTGRFDAQRVLADLDTHRALWKSFFMRRAIMPTFDSELPAGELIPLRDLHRCWNLDTLYILVQNEAALDPLRQIADEWGCEVGHYDVPQAEQLLGSTRRSPPILWCWWD